MEFVVRSSHPNHLRCRQHDFLLNTLDGAPDCAAELPKPASIHRKTGHMIITSTPLRISFFGGGTDYPVWYREYGGSVLSTTIDKCCYINCRRLPPFFEYHSRISYSRSRTLAGTMMNSAPIGACMPAIHGN